MPSEKGVLETSTVPLGALMLAITVLFIAFSWHLVIKYWNSSLLKARDRKISVLLLIGMSVLLLESAAQPFTRNSSFYETAFKFANAQFVVVGVLPYLLKGFILMVKFEVSYYMSITIGLDKTLHQTSDPEPRNWFVRNQWLIKSSFPMLGIWVLCSLFLLIPPGLSNDLDSLTKYQLLIALLNIIAYLWLFKKLRGKYDAWGIKQEFKVNGIIGFVLMLVYLAYYLSPQTEVYELAAGIVLWMLFNCIVLNSFVYPLLQNQKLESSLQRQQMMLGSSKSLKEFLMVEENYISFRNHMAKELALENVIFCREVAKYEKIVDEYLQSKEKQTAKAIVNMAHQIYITYIPEDSPCTVNISHVHRIHLQESFESLLELLEDLESGAKRGVLPKKSYRSLVEVRDDIEEVPEAILTMFKESELEILTLMETSSFPRFKRTPAFKKLKAEMNTQQLVEAVMLSTPATLPNLNTI
jgi:hypothetical protein